MRLPASKIRSTQRVDGKQHQIVGDDGRGEPHQDRLPPGVGVPQRGRFDGGQDVAEQCEAGDECQQVQRMRSVHRAESIRAVRMSARPELDGARPIWCCALPAGQGR